VADDLGCRWGAPSYVLGRVGRVMQKSRGGNPAQRYLLGTCRSWLPGFFASRRALETTRPPDQYGAEDTNPADAFDRYRSDAIEIERLLTVRTARTTLSSHHGAHQEAAFHPGDSACRARCARRPDDSVLQLERNARPGARLDVVGRMNVQYAIKKATSPCSK